MAKSMLLHENKISSKFNYLQKQNKKKQTNKQNCKLWVMMFMQKELLLYVLEDEDGHAQKVLDSLL